MGGSPPLAILSKFGRLEAAGKGLRGTFAAAIENSIPLLSSLSPAVAEEWTRFAGPRFETLRADAAEIDAWIAAVLGLPRRGEPAGRVGAMPTATMPSEPWRNPLAASCSGVAQRAEKTALRGVIP
jgi:Protein of unknown function (DUF2478)